jgi:alpha 1,3-glucosidase
MQIFPSLCNWPVSETVSDMLPILFAFVLTANRTHYRTCAQSRYCGRNRAIGPQGWRLISGSEVILPNSYEAVINDTTWDNVLSLQVSFLESGAVRVRIAPHCPEDFPRFDAASEPTIVDQRELSSTLPVAVSVQATQTILRAGRQTLTIQSVPFSLALSDETGLRVTLNPDDTAVFESGREPDRNPELFAPIDFNGAHDPVKNGPTGVALSLQFHAPGVRLSGLAAHTLPLTLPVTAPASEPIRFFNVDLHHFEVGNGMSMYGAIPFLMARSAPSSDGVFWCNPSETWVDTGASSARFISEGGYIDVFLFSGAPASVSNAFTRLTGRPQLVPQWALGYHQCRWGYLTAAEVRTVSARLDEAAVPHDVLWLDLDHTDDRKYFTFHPENFPDPRGFADELAARGRTLVVLVDPHLRRNESYWVYREALAGGLLLKDGTGDDLVAHCWPGASVWPDFLNPAAREWWETNYGFEKFTQSRPNVHIWNDMNELSAFDAPEGTTPRDAIHIGGIEDREVHNIYGHLMISATYGGLVKRNPSQNLRPFILTRSFFAGSQKYAAAWTGDNTADWDYMQSSIPMALSFGICGMIYSGSDVGGFFNNASENLIARWHQVATWLNPFFRNHAHHRVNYREIYLLHDEAAVVAREAVLERYRFLPYWYTLARIANLTGSPIVRPLWWEFPEERFIDTDDRGMLGPALFAVPFLAEAALPVAVAFPAGARWYALRTLAEVHGSDAVLPFDGGRTAVFLRGGSIVPTKPTVRGAAAAMTADPLTLLVGVGADGRAAGELYLDDGETFDFARGGFLHVEFAFGGGALTARVVAGAGSAFASACGATVAEVRITGLSTAPTRAECGGAELAVSADAGVVTVRGSIPLQDGFVLKVE